LTNQDFKAAFFFSLFKLFIQTEILLTTKEESMKIFVGNLSPEVLEQELNTLFSEHGSVSSVKIARDISTQMSRGFGFVEMPRKVDAKKALKSLNEFELKGEKIVVNEAKQERDRKSAGNRKKSSYKRR
jgi:RNA recognition motif-containing protein